MEINTPTTEGISSITESITQTDFEQKLKLLQEQTTKARNESEKRDKEVDQQLSDLVADNKKQTAQMTRLELGMTELMSSTTEHNKRVEKLESQLTTILDLLRGAREESATAKHDKCHQITQDSQEGNKDHNPIAQPLPAPSPGDPGGGRI